MDILLLLGIAFACLAVARLLGRAADAPRKRFPAEVAAERAALVDGDRADIPVLDPAAHGYRPVRGEHLVAVLEDVGRLELRSTGVVRTAGASVSVAVAPGFRIRAGSGRVAAGRELQEVDRGRLVLTTAALAFEGERGNDRLTWPQIAAVAVDFDEIAVNRRSGPQRLFRCARPDARFAALLSILMDRDEG